LHILAALIVAATFPLPVNAQQQPPASAEAPVGGTQQENAVTHAVTPPKVSCRGNTLSISANYSALGAILSEIQKCTGVQFDAPEMAKSYLVFDEIGPGPSNDVLAALLTASGFDYIIGASAVDPEKVEKIVLLARADDKDGGSPDMKGASPGRRAFAQMREAARPHTPEEQAAAAAEIEKGDTDTGGPSQPGAGASEPDSAPAKSDGSKAKPGGDSTATDAQAASGNPLQDASSQGKTTSDATAANADTPPPPPAQDTPN
jgi:hypothetical protein